jgi:hypothetical protein
MSPSRPDNESDAARSEDDQPVWTAPALTPPARPVPDPSQVAASAAAAPDAVAFTGRTGTPSKLRAGVVAGAAVALAVGAVATSFAATPSPAPSAGTTSGITTPAAPFAGNGGITLPGGAFDEHGPGGLGDRGGFGPGGFRDITIEAINGSSISLKTADGWTRTIDVTSSVTLTKGGQAITVADLAVGDSIRFAQTRNDDGTYTVTAIAVIVPSVSGEVSDVTSSGFKVTARDGSVWTITVDGSTEYHYGTGDGSLADVKAGGNVRVQGETNGDNALTALSVQVAGDHAVGTVTGKTADTITLKLRDGSSVTVHVDADTVYRVPANDAATLSDIAVDMVVGVDGRARADGSIDAATVGAGFKGNGFGRGGHDGHGDDKATDPNATPAPTPQGG